ncbi:hypothetical protein [Mammaliicoccus sciuri]|uniref:hypothetical protein n=1 Tax=Mammaliicoccus sciuri TaxID=1296 RepID=UPI001E54402F|nr:hypothetical protein [Mammaliicoccus sciuri]MCD8881420.1 hypothetical protein [Mammaliicoccus sciuri]MEB7783479.1 hypothetical protein [Mammaliicoccus sciuri]
MLLKDFSLVGVTVSIIMGVLTAFIKKYIPGKIDSRKTIFYIDITSFVLLVLLVWIFYLIYYLSIFMKISTLHKEENFNTIVFINTVISLLNIFFSIGALIITIQVIVMLKNNFKIIIQDNEIFKNKTFGKSYLKNMIHVEKKKDIERDIDRLKNNRKKIYSIKSYTMKDNENQLVEKIFVYNKSLWLRWKNISSKRDDKKYPFVSLLKFLTAFFIFTIINILTTTLIKSEGNEWLLTILNFLNVVVLIIFNAGLMNERTHINIKNLEDQNRYIEKEELKFK